VSLKISNPMAGCSIGRRLRLLVVLSVGILSLQCTDKPVSAPTQPAGRRSPMDVIIRSKDSLVESSNKFGLKLFREINAAQGDSNIFISPLSVSMALGMTYNGANGGTRAAMAQTLELAGLNIQEVNETYRNLLDLLSQLDPEVQLQIANSIWYRPDFQEPEVEFLNLCHEYFNALVTELDFNDPNAAAIINAWVEENTNGKIEEIVDDPIVDPVAMFLINAIYFKGAWTYQFDENLTQDCEFTLPDGSVTSCQMMEQKALHRYNFNDNFQAVDLPYGDGTFSMTIFLPGDKNGLDALISQFDPDNLSSWLSGFSSDSVNVYIPRFRLEYGRELIDDLTTLGMGIAFTPAADFTNMYAGGGVWIGRVRHKAFVEINEEGTEAAAATDVEIWFGLHDPIFLANRPFVFMIRENESGTILFVGKLVNPSTE
jgi:serine protease inhibitor